mgnify:CR=1 FL=1
MHFCYSPLLPSTLLCLTPRKLQCTNPCRRKDFSTISTIEELLNTNELKMTKKILDSTVAEEEEDDEADPNGHSHKTNNFKMESMMKPFMGFSKMFSRRNSAPRREELRRVKIDFSQNGAKLPEGSIETISAGGGKSPGHHEGGGLTVKVKEDEVQQRRIRIKQKPEPRKTLNFFFTW